MASIEGRSDVLTSWMTAQQYLDKPEHKFLREELCGRVHNFSHFGVNAKEGQLIVKFEGGYAIMQRDKQHETVIQFDVLYRENPSQALYNRLGFWYNEHSVKSIGDRARQHPEMRRGFDVLFLGGDV